MIDNGERRAFALRFPVQKVLKLIAFERRKLPLPERAHKMNRDPVHVVVLRRILPLAAVVRKIDLGHELAKAPDSVVLAPDVDLGDARQRSFKQDAGDRRLIGQNSLRQPCAGAAVRFHDDAAARHAQGVGVERRLELNRRPGNRIDYEINYLGDGVALFEALDQQFAAARLRALGHQGRFLPVGSHDHRGHGDERPWAAGGIDEQAMLSKTPYEL